MVCQSRLRGVRLGWRFGRGLGSVSWAVLFVHGGIKLTVITVKLQRTQLVRYNSGRHPETPLTELIRKPSGIIGRALVYGITFSFHPTRETLPSRTVFQSRSLQSDQDGQSRR